MFGAERRCLGFAFLPEEGADSASLLTADWLVALREHGALQLTQLSPSLLVTTNDGALTVEANVSGLFFDPLILLCKCKGIQIRRKGTEYFL